MICVIVNDVRIIEVGMCSCVANVNIARLCEDFKVLMEEGYDRKDIYKVLKILELREQTARLELISRSLVKLND